MSDSQEPQAEPLTLEETARAAADVAKRGEADRVAAAFLELVQRWAAPSAVLAALRDPDGVAGFRLVPSLCTGSIALGIERTLARLVEDTPECLARPTVVRGEEVPGIRVRDNVVVPWWCEGDSGLLVLRGVPRPTRPGLGEALALAAAVVWPRLLGGPAARVETLVQELQSAAARLERESARQLERLSAAAAPVAPPAAETASADAARFAELEQTVAKLEQGQKSHGSELEAAKRELGASHRELETARQELEDARRQLEASRRDSETSGRALESARRETESARHDAESARHDFEAARREAETARQGLGTLRHDLETAQRERETAGLDLAAARQQADNARRELATAVEERRTAERDLDVARRELASRIANPAAVETPTTEMAAAKPATAASEALKLAIAAVRRAAFLPPMLRVSMEEVGALASPEPKPARRHGIALLDRDVVSLEPIAAELEQAGVEVRLANQPEEVALLIRTPDASGLDAVVCDVMCFRPDQNVAGLLRGWDKDRSGLSFFLSYDAQSPVELERARRTPMSLTGGHIQRPLSGARLMETLENLAAKRQGKLP